MSETHTSEQIRVIIADDESRVREPVAEYLRKYGFYVDTAGDAEQTISLLMRSNGQYDVILLGDIMPDRGGSSSKPMAVALTKEIKTRFPNVQIIVLSSWGMDSAIEVLREGAYRFMAKPFNLDEIILNIRVAADVRKNETVELSIFLCHSSSDKTKVRELYQRLSKDGFTPWLDEENLLPGQDWQQEIPEAVRKSDIVLVCLSKASINKVGYVQKEIRCALDVADEQPEGKIFIIPLKLEECEVPNRLSKWQWVNYFDENGYKRLLDALHARAEAR
jgi:DNA-binding response OmpR family regulator